MIGAFDTGVQMPIMDLYDTRMMLAAQLAAKDMYLQALQDMKDFTTRYGDFMSPFAKDMETYGKMVGGVKDAVDKMYAAGINPLTSPEGRNLISRLTNSIDPSTYNTMRANAKIGYSYIEAMQKLRQQGKYSEAQELYDILRNGGTRFEDFGTVDPITGKLNMWDRSSPILAATLQELTKSGYTGRTARLLSEADFNDPRLKGYTFDPRYEWSGYLYSDLLKGAPGAIMSASADPRMAYFKDLAEQKVAASGRPYTLADVDAQFQRDVADANTWALIDPTRKADEFAVKALEHRYDLETLDIKHAHDVDLFNREADLKRELAQIKEGLADGAYSLTNNIAADAEGTLKGLIINYDDKGKINSVDQDTANVINRLIDMQAHPDRYSEGAKKLMMNRAKELGLLDGADKANSIAAKKKISIGMEGFANQVLEISDKASNFFTNTRARAKELNTMLHDLSSTAGIQSLTKILSEFGRLSDDGSITLPKNSDRLVGIGDTMYDVLSRGYADGAKHSNIDKALKSLKDGNLSKFKNRWTADTWELVNTVGDGNSKIYPTGKVVSGDRYYYIEVSNDPSDFSESCWFKIERDKLNNGGINPVLSTITQRIDDDFLHEFSHTNVIGNQQSVVGKYNK